MTQDPAHPDAQPTAAPRGSRLRAFGRGLLFFFGIVLPLGTLVLEAMTGLCAGMLFDPIPTVGHGALIAVVPLANLLAWLAATRRMREGLWWVGLLNGAALAVSFCYAVLFLPVLPIAALGLAAILYFGVGLVSFLPMSPLLSFVCTLRYRRLVRQSLPPGQRLPAVWWGAAAAAVLLFASSLPDLATKIALRFAASPDPARSLAGVETLRSIGRRDVILRACYQEVSRPLDLVGWLAFMRSDLTTARARDIYFRVTGESFSSRPAPDLWAGRRGRWTGADEFDFDPEQGGEAVAGRLRGLALSDSRLDGSVDADAAVGYIEWTMVFRNDAALQREARAQVLLPQGGVVSRLTLWVNGEEREAAFAARSRVREAYQKVVRQRRDPVLVTTCGPDRILVQCFPVPPNGGEMKIRIGITVPLAIEQPARVRLPLPCMLERNFGFAEGCRHGVWIESRQALSAGLPALHEDRSAEGVCALRGDLSDAELRSPAAGASAARDPARLAVWAADPTDATNGVLQRFVEAAAAAPDRIVVVIDASEGMAESLPAVAEAVASAMPDVPFAVLAAGDAVGDVAPLGSGPAARAAAAARLATVRCAGGQDNTVALLKAWDLAAESERGAVLWIHGPQAYLLSAGEALRQRLERRPSGPTIHEIQTGHGPNRLIEKLDGLAALRHVGRRGDLGGDLAGLLRGWRSDATAWQAVRERRPAAELSALGAPEGSRHLVRLWARDKAMADFAPGQPERLERAAALGARYNLVTPLTGAVVLETQAQFAEAGLEPVAPGSVPTVPEPEVWAMLAVACAFAAWAAVRPRLRRAQ